MKKSAWILLAALTAGIAAYSLPLLIQQQRSDEPPNDRYRELEWLEREFALSTEQRVAIRNLHEAYWPVCDELCLRVAEAQDELNRLLLAPQIPPADLDAAITAYTKVLEKCHRSMLSHILAVADLMDPDDRHRYLAKAGEYIFGHDAALSGHHHPDGS